ncbi:MAG: D-alanyl-D-alanine carboxypeptidase family protein [Minisyncoccales bacterium]
MVYREKIAIGIFVLLLLTLCLINVGGGYKHLNNFFYWYSLSQQTRVFKAELVLEEKFNEAKPFKKRGAPELNLTAKSAISVFVDKNGREKTLFEQNSDEIRPIASLTKLMTALVVLENYDLNKNITISTLAASQPGESKKKLVAGQVFPTEYLLYPLLMESSNAAAYALANDYEGINETIFVNLMNETAKKMGLENTFFYNSSGLDPENLVPARPISEINYSTARDLAKFAKNLLEKDLIWQILSLPSYSLYGPELINTNQLLNNGKDLNGWQKRILGGKTGYTERAGGCLLLVTVAPKDKGYLINLVLGANGSDDRFVEMKKILNWLIVAYQW